MWNKFDGSLAKMANLKAFKTLSTVHRPYVYGRLYYLALERPYIDRTIPVDVRSMSRVLLLVFKNYFQIFLFQITMSSFLGLKSKNWFIILIVDVEKFQTNFYSMLFENALSFKISEHNVANSLSNARMKMGLF